MGGVFTQVVEVVHRGACLFVTASDYHVHLVGGPAAEEIGYIPTRVVGSSVRREFVPIPHLIQLHILQAIEHILQFKASSHN